MSINDVGIKRVLRSKIKHIGKKNLKSGLESKIL
jgi:hypothetical protein